MKARPLTMPELMLIAGTRGMAGIGIGLLVAEKLNRTLRTTLGVTLLAVGALSTLPILLDVLTKPVVRSDV